MVYDPTQGAKNKVYVDDKMYNMVTYGGSNSQGTGKMVLGRKYNNLDMDYFQCMIDDLKMWNRILTHEEIVQLNE